MPDNIHCPTLNLLSVFLKLPVKLGEHNACRRPLLSTGKCSHTGDASEQSSTLFTTTTKITPRDVAVGLHTSGACSLFKLMLAGCLGQLGHRAAQHP